MMCANIFFGGGRKRIKHVKSKSLDCSHSQKQIFRTFIFGHGYRFLASVFIRIPQPHRHFDPIDVVLSCAVFKAARKILMWNSNLCAIRAWVCVHCTSTTLYTALYRIRNRIVSICTTIGLGPGAQVQVIFNQINALYARFTISLDLVCFGLLSFWVQCTCRGDACIRYDSLT